MKIFTLVLICFFYSLNSIIAQDTIFFKNSEKIVALVKEVSPTEIQYKKIELPDGPMYVANKTEVEKITYKNGYTETIKSIAAAEEKPFVVQYETTPAINNEKITYKDTKRRSFYLSNLVNTHPDVNRRPILLKSVRSMKSLKAGQDATRTVAVVFGAVGIATGAVYGVFASLSGTTSDFIIVPTVLGSGAIVLTAAAITFNINLNKKRNAFVRAYNE